MDISGELWELLHAGDWACAHGDDEALERVAAAIAARVSGEEQALARRVMTLASGDMGTASLLWGRLTEKLRAWWHAPSHAG